MKIWKAQDPVTKRYKFHAEFTCAGKRHRVKADTKDELADIIDAIKKRARQKKYGLEIEYAVVTLGELVKSRVADLNLTKKGHRRTKAILEQFAKHSGLKTPVHHLKTADLIKFVRARRLANKDLKGSSINRELHEINALLHRAERYFPALESWKPPRMPFEPEPEGRERLITEEERALLFFDLRAPRRKVGKKRPRWEMASDVRARHTVADLFEHALLTGVRHTEGRTLSWSKIDWAISTIRDPRSGEEITVYGEISLTKTKTGKARKVPLNRDARDLLERRRAESTGPWIFPNTAGTRPISMTVVYRILRRAAERAGVVYGRNIEDGFVFHDSRHTAATGMLQGGSDLKTVGSILGHSDETMTMRYSHATAVSRAGAVTSLKKRRNEAEVDEK